MASSTSAAPRRPQRCAPRLPGSSRCRLDRRDRQGQPTHSGAGTIRPRLWRSTSTRAFQPRATSYRRLAPFRNAARSSERCPPMRTRVTARLAVLASRPRSSPSPQVRRSPVEARPPGVRRPVTPASAGDPAAAGPEQDCCDPEPGRPVDQPCPIGDHASVVLGRLRPTRCGSGTRRARASTPVSPATAATTTSAFPAGTATPARMSSTTASAPTARGLSRRSAGT